MKRRLTVLFALLIVLHAVCCCASEESSSLQALSTVENKQIVTGITNDMIGYRELEPVYGADGSVDYLYKLCGYMDIYGNTVIEPQYTSVSEFSEGLALVHTGDGIGYLSPDGKLALTDESWDFGSDFKNGYAIVYSNILNEKGQVYDQRYGIIDTRGKTAWLPEGLIIDMYTAHVCDGLVPVKRKSDSLYGFCDVRGNVVMQPQWTAAQSFSEGFAAVKNDIYWEFINTLGEELGITRSKYYEQVQPFSEGLAAVYDGVYWQYIDRLGDFCFTASWDVPADSFITEYTDNVELLFKAADWSEARIDLQRVTPFANGLAIAETKYNGGMSSLFNAEGVTLLTPYHALDYRGQFTWNRILAVKDNLLIVENAEGKQTLADMQGQTLMDFRWDQIIDYQDNILLGKVNGVSEIVYLREAAVRAIDYALETEQFEKAAQMPMIYQKSYNELAGIPLAEYTAQRLFEEHEYGLSLELSSRADLYDQTLIILLEDLDDQINSGDFEKAEKRIAQIIMYHNHFVNIFDDQVYYYDRAMKALSLITEHAPAYCFRLSDAYVSAGMYSEALALLEKISAFADCTEQIGRVRMAEAAAQGMTYASFEQLISAEDAQAIEAVQPLLDAGTYREAAYELALYGTAGTLRKAYEIRYTYLMDDRIAVDGHVNSEQITALAADGTVYTTLENWGRSYYESAKQFQESTDFVAVAAGASLNVGLRADGTVFCGGLNSKGQAETQNWTDIVAVAAGEYHTVGLRADGTVVAVGDNTYGQLDVSDWSDVIAIDAHYSNTFALCRDGTVLVAGKNADRMKKAAFQDAVDIAAGELLIILRKDGTVVNEYGDVIQNLKGAIAIDASAENYVGLNADAEALVRARDSRDEQEASAFSDIAAIKAGVPFIVAVTRSGELLITTHRSGPSEPRQISHFGTLLPPALAGN